MEKQQKEVGEEEEELDNTKDYHVEKNCPLGPGHRERRLGLCKANFTYLLILLKSVLDTGIHRITWKFFRPPLKYHTFLIVNSQWILTARKASED